MRILLSFLIISLAMLFIFIKWDDPQVNPNEMHITEVQNTEPDIQVHQPQSPTIPHEQIDVTEPSEIPRESVDIKTPDKIDLGRAQSFDDANEKLKSLGIDENSEISVKWRKQRGYALMDANNNLYLDKSYEDLDEKTLLELAKSGDMWAQQFYAERIETSYPGDAIHWYRKAAKNGSIYAMQQLSNLYRNLSAKQSNLDLPDTYKQQLDEIHNRRYFPDQLSVAWTIVAQMAGANPTLNSATKERIENDFRGEVLTRICLIAETIYSDLQQARFDDNQGSYDRSAPPFMLGSIKDLSKLPCADIYSISIDAGPDFSGCKETEVRMDGLKQYVVQCGYVTE